MFLCRTGDVLPARNENLDRYGSIGLSFVCEFFKTLLDSCGFALYL